MAHGHRQSKTHQPHRRAVNFSSTSGRSRSPCPSGLIPACNGSEAGSGNAQKNQEAPGVRSDSVAASHSWESHRSRPRPPQWSILRSHTRDQPTNRRAGSKSSPASSRESAFQALCKAARNGKPVLGPQPRNYDRNEAKVPPKPQESGRSPPAIPATIADAEVFRPRLSLHPLPDRDSRANYPFQVEPTTHRHLAFRSFGAMHLRLTHTLHSPQTWSTSIRASCFSHNVSNSQLPGRLQSAERGVIS